MEYEFLKENILQSRQNDKSGKNTLRLLKLLDKQNEYLQEINFNIFLELLDFLSNTTDVFVLTGDALCGKSLLTSIIPKLVSEQTICHFFKCTPSSTNDDVLLTFFETFMNYAKKGIVHLPKLDTKIFQQRINAYLTKCENPIVIVIDGFNELQNKKNKDEIMEFLSQVAEMPNIKMVITSRKFDITDLKNIKLKVATSIVKPLTLDNLKDYCLKNVIKSDGIDEFFELSKGSYKNLNLAMTYITPTNLTIKEFLEELKASNKDFDTFVVNRILTLIPTTYSHLLWILSVANFAIPKNNVLKLIDDDEEQLNILSKKGIIELQNDKYYIKDYFANEIMKNIEPIAHQNIIKALIKFLDAQLPLKPSERELKLSRITIRNEIERLNKIITKTTQTKTDKNKSAYLNILGYSKQFKTNWDGFDEVIMPKKTSYNEQINKNVDKIENQSRQTELEMIENKKKEQTALELAQILKNKYQYRAALSQYSEALSDNMDAEDKNIEMTIYKESAECYFKLGDYKNAVENYSRAHVIAEYYQMHDEANSIMLQIAELYKLTYKQNTAKEIYFNIIKSSTASDAIKLQAEISLFETDFSHLTPSEIIKQYYELLEKAENNKDISSKLHFRLAYLYDKASSLDEAILHYKKSIEICDDYNLNINLSSCYFNLAEIYFEQKEYDLALDNYLKSYTIDEIMKKSQDLILTSKKIAKIYERRKNSLALEYYEKALDFAKLSNDNYFIACAHIDIGDYYYKLKQDIKALKSYMAAQKTLENQLTTENDIAIKDRINDLKVRMGKEVVENLIREFYE